jgi:galactokinase
VTVPEDDPRLTELGELLVQSHESCKVQYDCTHVQTDALKDLCLECGALGARQTGESTNKIILKSGENVGRKLGTLTCIPGGGWGGAVISLVLVSKAEDFLKEVKKRYGPYQDLSEEKVLEAAFATLPGSGAGVYVVGGGEVKQ